MRELLFELRRDERESRGCVLRASEVNQDSRGVGSGQGGGRKTEQIVVSGRCGWGRRSRSVGGEAGKQGEWGGQEDFGEQLASWHTYSSCCCVSLGE